MKDKINWKQTFTTALVTVTVTVIAGMLLFYFQSSKPSLSYSISQVEPFQSKLEQLTIYHITLSNESNSIVENIQGYIEVKPANIKDYKTNSEFPLSIKDSLESKSKLYIKIDNLNSNESVNISLMASSNTNIPEQPKIMIRANGVIAEIKESKQMETREPFYYLVILATLASFVATVFIRFTKDKFSKVEENLDEDELTEKGGKHIGVDQQHVFAYLLNLEGLDELANKYRIATQKITYWSESDALMFEAMKKDEMFQKKIINVFLNLFKYSRISKTSLAIINYNISKLYKSINEQDLYEKYLTESKKIAPSLINKRLDLEK